MFAVRLDMETPGTMLMRDMESGEVYGLQTEGFQQVRGARQSEIPHLAG